MCVQDDKERKRLEALERKREKQRLLEEEEAKIKGKQTKEVPSKVTRAQIEENIQSGQNVKETKEKGKSSDSDVQRCLFNMLTITTS